MSGLSASYSYYPDNSGDGSITIAYSTGAPGAPTWVSGIARNTSVDLTWTAPGDVGQDAISDYLVQFAPASDPTSWTTFPDGISTDTSATVTGLTNGTGYVFQIIPVNAVGDGTASASTGTITPSGPPAAPASNGSAITGYTATAFTAATAGSQAATCTTSGELTCTLTGLTNDTPYYVSLQPLNTAGLSARSAPRVSATPRLLPGTVPTASTPVRTADGYTVTVTNYSPSVTYDVQATNGSTAEIDTSGRVRVTGLAPGTSSTATVTASRTGYTTTSASIPGSALTLVVSPGDFTGDHQSDILATLPNGDLHLYRGNGHGGFTGTPTTVGHGWGSFTEVLSPGDFTGDQQSDLLATLPNGDLHLYRGNGHGGFTGTPTKVGHGWGSFTRVFSPGDFTGDQ